MWSCVKDVCCSVVPINVRLKTAVIQSATVLLVWFLRGLLAVWHQECGSIPSAVVISVTARCAVNMIKMTWDKANIWGRLRGQGGAGGVAASRGRLAVGGHRWRGRAVLFALSDEEGALLPFVMVWDHCGPADWVGNRRSGGQSVARFPHNTAAGAGLRAGRVVPQRSIPIDMEYALRKETIEKKWNVLWVRTWIWALNSLRLR